MFILSGLFFLLTLIDEFNARRFVSFGEEIIDELFDESIKNLVGRCGKDVSSTDGTRCLVVFLLFPIFNTIFTESVTAVDDKWKYIDLVAYRALQLTIQKGF